MKKRYYAETSGIEEGGTICRKHDGSTTLCAAIYLELYDRKTGEHLGSVRRDLIWWVGNTPMDGRYDEDGNEIEVTPRQWKNEYARAFEELQSDLEEMARDMGIKNSIDFSTYRDEYDEEDWNDFYFD